MMESIARETGVWLRSTGCAAWIDVNVENVRNALTRLKEKEEKK